MSWLTSNSGLFFGFLPFLLACGVIRFFTGKDPKTNKPLSVWWREERQQNLSELDWPVKNLLKSGFHGAILRVNFPEFNFHIQFRKYIRSKDDYGIVLLLPNAAGSDSRFAGLRRYCECNGITFQVERDASDGIVEFLCIDCAIDPDLAYQLLKMSVIDVAGIPENARHVYSFEGMARSGQLVNSPNDPPSTDDAQRTKNEAFRELVGVSIVEGWLFMVMLIAKRLGYLGLLYSLFVSIMVLTFSLNVTWSVLSFQVLGLPMTSKIFDLLCLAIIVLALLELWTRAYWMFKLRRQGADEKERSELVNPNWRVDRGMLIRELWSRATWKGNILIVFIILSWIKL